MRFFFFFVHIFCFSTDQDLEGGRCDLITSLTSPNTHVLEFPEFLNQHSLIKQSYIELELVFKPEYCKKVTELKKP